ncbi:MAG: type II toxin-antitoxin system RelE/ParE family toxin [Pseudobdellovibrionaceae bacterium]
MQRIVNHVQHNFNSTIAEQVFLRLLLKINSLAQFPAGKIENPKRELFSRVIEGNIVLFRIKKNEIFITDIKPRKTNFKPIDEP